MKRTKFSINLFVLFFILLSLKTYFTRVTIFSDYNVFSVFWLEMTYVVLLFIVIEFIIRKGKLFFYVLVNLVVSALLFSVVLYYEFFGIVVSHHALYAVHQVGEVSESIWTLLKPVHLFYFIDIIVIILVISLKKVRFTSFQSGKALIGLFILTVAITGFHLFFSNDEMNFDSFAVAETKGIFNYQVIEIYSDIQTVEGELAGIELTNEEIRELKGLAAAEEGEPDYFGVAKGRNIIVIQFESLQNFAIGLEIDGQEITPNLNKLINEGLYFPKFYQQIGAGNTSDAEFMLNTSLYPPGSRGASEMYGDKYLPSLPRLLKNDGFHTATFHTNKVNFWNRHEMYAALGFDEYYDEEYFGTEDYFLMGATDEVLYGKTFEKLQEFSASDQPFYVNVISMTSHHPFDLPEEKRRIELPERFDDTFINDYLTSVHYADYALGNFITSLKASGMWDKSLIVTYGDHSGVHHSKISDEDKALLAELIGREYWFVDRLNIPLFITAPGELEPEVVTNVGGQIDMMPTIANLIGLSLDDQIHFGQDILNEEDNLLGMRYYLAKGSLFNPEVLLTPEGDNGTAYDLDTGAIVGERSDHQDDFNRVIKLLDLSDAYLDSLPQR